MVARYANASTTHVGLASFSGSLIIMAMMLSAYFSSLTTINLVFITTSKIKTGSSIFCPTKRNLQLYLLVIKPVANEVC